MCSRYPLRDDWWAGVCALILMVVQSDTAALSIPELELELSEGTMGGKYTTLVIDAAALNRRQGPVC